VRPKPLEPWVAQHTRDAPTEGRVCEGAGRDELRGSPGSVEGEAARPPCASSLLVPSLATSMATVGVLDVDGSGHIQRHS
jgi:hypothetical protein